MVLRGGIFLAYKDREFAGLGAIATGLAALTITFFKGKGGQEAKIQEPPTTSKRR